MFNLLQTNLAFKINYLKYEQYFFHHPFFENRLIGVGHNNIMNSVVICFLLNFTERCTEDSISSKKIPEAFYRYAI